MQWSFPDRRRVAGERGTRPDRGGLDRPIIVPTVRADDSHIHDCNFKMSHYAMLQSMAIGGVSVYDDATVFRQYLSA